MSYLNPEDQDASPGATNGIRLIDNNAAFAILFNSISPLSGTVLSATWINTANSGLSSGPGTVEFDGAYQGATVWVNMPDRTSFKTILPSGNANSTAVITLTGDGYYAVGPTQVRLRNLGYI